MIGPTDFFDEIDCGSFFDDLVDFPIVDFEASDSTPFDETVFPSIWATHPESSLPCSDSPFFRKTASDFSTELFAPSMVFAGTTVVNGNCFCLVTGGIGMETEIGKVHTQIHVASQSEEDTPLKKKLNEFVELLTMIIGVICILVWLIIG